MNHIEIKRRQIQLCSMGLGLVVIWILGKSIGDNGVTYLVVALEAFALLWMGIGASVSDTMGKILRGRNAKGQYKNAAKFRKSVFVSQAAVGLVCSALFFVLAHFLAEELLQVPYSRFLMMILAPVFFLRCMNAVFLGAFQGEGSELPTAVSGVLRQLLLLGFGLMFGKMLTSYGQKVSKLLGQDAFTSMYGGVGIAIAMIFSELLIFLFLLLIYKGTGRNRIAKERDGMRTTDSFGGQVYVLYRNMGFSVLYSLLLIFPLILGLILLQKNTVDIYNTADAYGVYVGKYLVACGVVIAVLTAMVLPGAVRTASMLRKDEHRYARNLFQSGLKGIIFYGLFFTVFFTVMASQLAETISTTMNNVLAEMFTVGSAIIVLGVLAYFGYVLLKLSGKKLWILACLGAANVVFAGTCVILFSNQRGNTMGLIYAGLGFVGVLAISLCLSASLQLRASIDWLRTIVIPIGCVSASGLLCYFLGKAITPHLGSLVTLLVVLVLAWMVYLALVVFLRCFGEQELNMVPGGKILRSLGQLLGVY